MSKIQQLNTIKSLQTTIKSLDQNEPTKIKSFNIYPLIVITFFVLVSFIYFIIHHQQISTITSLQLFVGFSFYMIFFYENIIKKKGENMDVFIFMNIFYMIFFSLFYDNTDMVERFTPVFFLFLFILFKRSLFSKLIFHSFNFLRKYYHGTIVTIFIFVLILSSLNKTEYESLIRFLVFILFVYYFIMFFIKFSFDIYPNFWNSSAKIFKEN